MDNEYTGVHSIPLPNLYITGNSHGLENDLFLGSTQTAGFYCIQQAEDDRLYK